MSTVLLVHAGATWFMVGLIWFVQLVHYPLFSRVGAASTSSYAAAHQRQTTWIVGPVMLIEAVTAGVIVSQMPGALEITGGILLVIAWLSTAFLQVPRHREILAAASTVPTRTIEHLVRTNWIRTACWSARGVVALLLLHPT